MNKSADKWRCSNCHSKQCTLRRAFGRWPTESFTSMDKADRVAFWRSIENIGGKDSVCKASEHLVRFESHCEKYYDRLQKRRSVLANHKESHSTKKKQSSVKISRSWFGQNVRQCSSICSRYLSLSLCSRILGLHRRRFRFRSHSEYDVFLLAAVNVDVSRVCRGSDYR